MDTRVGRRWSRVVLAAVVVVGIVTLSVPSVEARARVRSRSGSSLSSAPSVSKPHVPSRAPDAAKPHVASPGGSSVSLSVPSVPADNRGMFRRFWDTLLGRTPPPAPAPAPQVAQSATGAGRLSSARGAAAGVGLAGAEQAAGQPAHGQPAVAALGGNPSLLGATAGAVAGSMLPASADPSADKAAAEARARIDRQASLGPRKQEATPRTPNGYILHLTNGRSVSVAAYEEKGDQLVIPWQGGSFGLHKLDIARIEPRYTAGR